MFERKNTYASYQRNAANPLGSRFSLHNGAMGIATCVLRVVYNRLVMWSKKVNTSLFSSFTHVMETFGRLGLSIHTEYSLVIE